MPLYGQEVPSTAQVMLGPEPTGCSEGFASRQSLPTAPTFVRSSEVIKTPVVLKKTPQEMSDLLTEQFNHATKEAMQDFMDLIFNLKKDKNLDHKFRIQVFSKIFECEEKEAAKYYKAFKVVWKFQNLKQTLLKHIKNLID